MNSEQWRYRVSSVFSLSFDEVDNLIDDLENLEKSLTELILHRGNIQKLIERIEQLENEKNETTLRLQGEYGKRIAELEAILSNRILRKDGTTYADELESANQRIAELENKLIMYKTVDEIRRLGCVSYQNDVEKLQEHVKELEQEVGAWRYKYLRKASGQEE